MFLVINKSKILSYIVAICTVIILFMLASNDENMESMTTGANILENDVNIQNEMSNIIENNI